MSTRKEKARTKKRVAIAQDVIAQINGHLYTVRQMVYVQFAKTGLRDRSLIRKGGDLQKMLPKLVSKSKPCGVCGLGSMFISAVRLYDQVDMKDVRSVYSFPHDIQHEKLRKVLSKWFTLDELALIEACFERDPKFIGGENKPTEFLPSEEQRRRRELETAYKFRAFLAGLDSTHRLQFLMRAVAANAHKEITLPVLRIYTLVEMGSHPDRFVARINEII